MKRSATNPRVELQERLRFETLIADLSSKFVNLPAGGVDSEIMEAERRICDLLDLDVAALWQWSDGPPGFFKLTHYYSTQESPLLPEGVDGSEFFPWVHQEMLAGRIVAVSSLTTLPAEAARDRESACQLGVKSNLTLPLSVGGQSPIGALGLNTTRAERGWPDQLVKRLQLVAQIFANALARKHADQALRESEERLTMATQAAEIGIWKWDMVSGEVWGTPRWMELFGFASGEKTTLEKTVQRIHPDDREWIVADVRRALDEGSQFRGDFRVELPDGTVGWINSRGKSYPSPDGKPARMLGAAIDVTERKHAEEAMRVREARLDASSALAGLGYYEVDFVRNTGFTDQRLHEICALTPGLHQDLQFLQFWMEHVHPDDRQRILDERQKLHEGRIQEISAEYRYLHPSQGPKWIHHLARIAERNDAGRSLRSYGVMRDISERKRIACAQAEDLRFVTLIADLSSRMVNLAPVAVDDTIEDAQRRICEILGLDLCTLWQWQGESQEILSMTHIHGILAAPLPAQFLADDFFPWCRKEVLAGHTIVVSHPDRLGPEASRDVESWKHFGAKSSVVFPLSTGDAPSIGALAFSTTQVERDWPTQLVQRLQLIAHIFASALARKRSDQALRESEEVNRATFEQAAVGIAHVATDGRWLRVNDRFCTIVGYPREELVQLASQHITHPDDLVADLNYLRQILDGEIQTCSVEKRFVRKDHSLVWTNLAVSLVRTEQGKPRHFIAAMEDITHRKRAEEETQRLRLQLWHADRVAQTGAITASLAHELNQPLTGILSTAQAGLRFLAGGNAAPALIREILTNVVHDTKRAGAVINGLRLMLRQKETQREPISLGNTIQEVFDLLHSELVGRQVEARQNLETDFTALADKAQIQQVILNLALNALEAMQDQPSTERRLEVSVTLSNKSEAQVAIRDSGPGIAETERDKVFQSFWTTKPQGMGIGLAVSRSIIESHGGRLWFENNPDRGATFFFTLPLRGDEGRGARRKGAAP